MRRLGSLLRQLGGWIYRCGCRLDVGAPAQVNPFSPIPAPVLFAYDERLERPTMELPAVGQGEGASS